MYYEAKTIKKTEVTSSNASCVGKHQVGLEVDISKGYSKEVFSRF
jgi:hypothetical protein